MFYTAFISYSHGTDYGFAVALEAALQTFAPPLDERSRIRLFRDASNLSATPGLWPTIQKALENSKFLLLIASEESAKSKWVNQEVEYWCAHKEQEHLLIALTNGTIAWDGKQGDFDFVSSTALPPGIGKAFCNEPLYVDFHGLLSQHYDLNHPVFCDRVAMIASTLRGINKDELFGLHVSRRIASEAARLSAESELALRDGFPERALLLGAAALKITDDRGESRSAAAESVVRSALSRFGGRPLGFVAYNAVAPPLTYSKDGRWIVAVNPDGHAKAQELTASETDAKVITLRREEIISKTSFTSDGHWLLAHSETAGKSIRLWNAQADFAEWHKIDPPEGKVFTCAVLSVEETHLAAGCDDGTVFVWDLACNTPGQPLATLNASGAVRLIGCAARRRRVAAITGDVLHLWDLAADSGTHQQISLTGARTFQLAISPDGSCVLCQGEPSFLVPFSKEEHSATMELTAYRGRIWKHSFSDDGRWLATATGPAAHEELLQSYYPEFSVRLWDLIQRKCWDLVGHEDIVCDVAIAADGERVISSSMDRTIRVWDFGVLRRFQEERIKHGSEGNATWTQTVPGGDAEAHERYVAQQAFRNHRVLLGGEDAIFHCVPSPDGKWLATATMGKPSSARLWHIENGFGASPLELPKIAPPDALLRLSATQGWFFYSVLGQASGGKAEFSANREWLILWVPGHLLLFDVLNSRRAAAWNDVPFEAARLSPDAQWLAVWSKGHVLATALNKSETLRTFSNDTNAVERLEFSACGRWLLTAEGNDCVCLRDVRRPDWNAIETALTVASSQPLNIAINQTGRLLFAGGNKGTGTVWEVDDAGHTSVYMEVTGHAAQDQLGSMRGQFTADGSWLLTTDLGTLQVWDLTARTLRFQFIQDNTKLFFATALTSDGRWLVTSKSGRVSLFDMQKAERDPAPLVIQDYPAGGIQFRVSPDSRWLVTSDVPFDSPGGRMAAPLERAAVPKVRVYDLWTANVPTSFVVLPDLGSEAQSVAISWDSRWLTTTGTSVKLWPLGVPNLLEIARQTSGRDFTAEERSRYMLEQFGV